VSLYWPQVRLALLIAASAWIFAHAWAAHSAGCSDLDHLGDDRIYMVATELAVKDFSICVPGRVGQTWEGFLDGSLVVSGVVPSAEVLTVPAVPRGHPVEFCTLWQQPDTWDCSDWMFTLDHDVDDDLIITGSDFAAFRSLMVQGLATGWDWNTFRALFGADYAEIDSTGHKVWR